MSATHFTRHTAFGAVGLAVYAGIAGWGMSAGTVRGGVINLTSQTRSVDVNTNGFSSLPPSEQQASASDFGPFDKTVNLLFTNSVSGQSASQQSSIELTADGKGALIQGNGRVFTSISFTGLNGSSIFDVAFNLTESEPYTLSYSGQTGDPRPTSPKEFVPGSFTGPSAPGILAADPHTTNFDSVLTFSGTLTPGSYQLSAKALAAFGVGPDASFSTTLAIGTAAVPLPSALWQVVAVLPVLIWGMWCVAAHRRRVRRG